MSRVDKAVKNLQAERTAVTRELQKTTKKQNELADLARRLDRAIKALGEPEESHAATDEQVLSAAVDILLGQKPLAISKLTKRIRSRLSAEGIGSVGLSKSLKQILDGPEFIHCENNSVSLSEKTQTKRQTADASKTGNTEDVVAN